MTKRFLTTAAIVTIMLIAATSTCAIQCSAINYPGPGRLAESEVLDRDKTGTTGGQKKKNDSQVANSEALASRVSFGAERTGFSESLPAADRRLQQHNIAQ